MSKANSVTKVLKTAYKRVTTRLGRRGWVQQDDNGNYVVCLEGALFGFCATPQTQAQIQARDLVREIIAEKYPDRFLRLDVGNTLVVHIPGFNDDPLITDEEIAEVVKLAWIRSETGGPMDDPQDQYINNEELEELF